MKKIIKAMLVVSLTLVAMFAMSTLTSAKTLEAIEPKIDTGAEVSVEVKFTQADKLPQLGGYAGCVVPIKMSKPGIILFKRTANTGDYTPGTKLFSDANLSQKLDYDYFFYRQVSLKMSYDLFCW